MPSEKVHPSIIKKLKKLPKELPKPPFYMLIMGMAGSGKTSLLYSIMKSYQETSYFDVIIIYTGTADSNDVWEKFENITEKGKVKTAVEIHNDYDDESFNNFYNELRAIQLKRQKDKKPPLQVLLVFDDMIFSGISKRAGSTKLDKMIINRRHLGCSIITLSQNYKALSPNQRINNLNQLILVDATLPDLEKIADENRTRKITVDMFLDIFEKIKEGSPYDFLLIDYKEHNKNKRFKKNFDTQIIIE